MDNTIDVLMAETEVARRIQLGPHFFERLRPFAEHGVLMLLRVKRGVEPTARQG